MEEEESYDSTIYGERSPTSRDNYDYEYSNPNNSEEEDEEESSDNHRTKRRKHAPTLEDRITTLPHSILLNILSFTQSYKTATAFASEVDDTLLLHRAPKLANFSVQFEYKSHLKRHLDLWVRFATTAKVDKLSLQLSSPCFSLLDANEYRLPQYLYANEFVSEFDFSYCKIKPIGLLCWVSLKRLCIRKSALCEDLIRKVLMGSPRLEYLELNDCYEFNRLDIVSESLRKLVIDSYLVDMLEREERTLELEIVAPKIECLEILGDFFIRRCRIKHVSALVEAKLDFDMWKGYDSDEEEGACEEFQDTERHS
ncbi:putative f-box/lrr-repeat protein [Quercus suber]|uniref:F-box/lrr-repeat protein n=1 Tax=Quercus suber TaxID=58331 RepID=A0AAW0K021_QUESU